MDKQKVIDDITLLLNKYTILNNDDKLKKYNESMTKNEFIEPLLECLGWDVRNKKIFDEVIKEEKVLRGRVDYALRLNGVNRLFIEAKSFKEDISDATWARQAIEYGYNKGVPFVVLTNFKEIKIFNSEWNEKNIWRCQVVDIQCNDFINNIDKLLLISREGIENNDLVDEAIKVGKRIPRKSVQLLLSEKLIEWRELIANDINQKYGEKYNREIIDEIAQKFIDRLIFIRTCEERNLEEKKLFESLSHFNSNRKKVWTFIKHDVYQYYRKEYDSNLFGKDEADLHELDIIELSENIVFKIIDSTYKYNEYEVMFNFGDIDSDVLGNAYEQYLGHVLRRSNEVVKSTQRKEQGIFYTPKFIVDYIVKNTVGVIVNIGNYDDIKKVKVIDISCGSGSFLIRAFDEIYNYYLIINKTTQKTLTDDYSLKIKTEILMNNLYGIDLDSNAIEIAQLNLMLKAAEKRQRLPILRNNIIVGNSIVNSEKFINLKPIKWESKFAEVSSIGGFDVVIGNPPYVQLSMKEDVDTDLKNYLIQEYGSSMGRLNTFGFFIVKSINMVKNGGRVGLIIPNTILTQEYYQQLRIFILTTCSIEKIVHFNQMQFKDAVVENVILILKKESDAKQRERNNIEVVSFENDYKIKSDGFVKQSEFSKSFKNSFLINYVDSKLLTLKKKIENKSTKLGELCDINQAIALKCDRASNLSTERVNESYKPVLDGRNINRYQTNWNGEYLKYDINTIHSCKTEDIFLSNEKIFFRRVDDDLIATIDRDHYYALNTLIVINKKKNVDIDLRYVLALFNSKLFSIYYKLYLKSTKKIFSEIQARQVAELPIRFASEKEVERVVHLVDQIMDINNNNKIITNDHYKITESVQQINDELDCIIFKIYNLSLEEINYLNSNI